MTLDTDGFVDLNKIPPETPLTVKVVLDDTAIVKTSAVEVTEDIVVYFTEPNVSPVISANVFPPAETLMFIGELVTSTVISPEVQQRAEIAKAQIHSKPREKSLTIGNSFWIVFMIRTEFSVLC